MFDINLLHNLCVKYKIKYKIFENTGVIYLETGLDDWLIKYVGNNRERPYCLMHKNKIKQTKKFHVQRYLKTLYQSLDCISRHKGVLKNIYASKNTYNKNYKYNNKRRKQNYC